MSAGTAALLALVAALVMLPSFLCGPSASHSAIYNFIWTKQFGEAIGQGIVYPRWLPSSFEGLGAPTFYFYPPMAFWVTGALNALGLPTLTAINVAALLVLLVSGVTMHAWLSAKGLPPVLGAILYMVAPYHLVDFWIRGALAEFTAFIWLPLIALGIDRLPERRGAYLLAAAYAALILTHLPVAMLTGIFLIAPLVLYKARDDRAILLPAAIAGIFAIALASFYLVPALLLQDHISSALLWRPYFQPSSWGLFSPMGLNQWSLYTAIGAGIIVLAWPPRSIWSGIVAVTGLSAMGLVPFIWDLPPLSQAQFPWRALCIGEFAAVTAVLIARPRRRQIIAGLIVLAVPFGVTIGQAWRDLHTRIDYVDVARTVTDAGEYLPAGFDFDHTAGDKHWPDLRAYDALDRGTDIIVSRPGRVTLRHAAFPIWRVYRNDREVASTGPLITFDAVPGRYQLRRVVIWQEQVGYAISLAALCVAIFAYGMHRPRRRKLPPVN